MQALEEQTGVKNPRLHSRPRLRADCKKYMRGYQHLSSARQFNEVGLMPLQIGEILAYIDLAGIQRGEPAMKYLRMIQTLDATHMGWWSKKNK